MEAEHPRWLNWAITLDSPQQPRERLSGKQTSLQQGGKGLIDEMQTVLTTSVVAPTDAKCW